MDNFYTTDLSRFGHRELKMLSNILHAWMEKGLPKNFRSTGISIGFNTASGRVFLINEEYQTAMMNGNDLQQFYSAPFGYVEGFLSDLAEEDPNCLHPTDVGYILNIAEADGFDLPQSWKF